jgi:hypothetical protein
MSAAGVRCWIRRAGLCLPAWLLAASVGAAWAQAQTSAAASAPGTVAGPAAPAAREPGPLVAQRLLPGERIALTGALDHPAWARAAAFDGFVEKDPDLGARPSHATRVKVLFDGQALYFGIEALDPQPQLIRAPLVRHDGVNRTQDFVVVYVDPVGSKQSAQFFRVNAAGSLADGMHTHADDNEDFAPDFDFDAATARTEQGWTAVMRIPFSSLRFPRDHSAPWRVMVARRVPREQYHLITSVLIPREAPSFINNLQVLAGLELPEDHAFLTLRPSLTVRRETRREIYPGQAPQREQIDSHAQGSLDVKWRPLPELVVDATLNPDFSQVELDVPQLRGNTLFALELAEKRPFFYESSDLLRGPSGGLYTRAFTEPRLGARASWRGARLAATAFVVDDRGGGQTLLPSPYFTGVATQPASTTLATRLKLDSGALQWGLLAVDRRYRDGQDQPLGLNRVIGPDLAWQIDEAWRLRGQWLSSATSADGTSGVLTQGLVTRGERRYLTVTRQVDGMQTDLTVDDNSEGFRFDSGFVPQNGVRSVEFVHGQGWQKLGPTNEFWLKLWTYQERDRRTGQRSAEYVTPGFWLSGAHNLEWLLQWRGYSLRRQSAGEALLRERYLYSELTYSPAPWLPLLEAHASLGRLADMVAGRVDPGGRLYLNLRSRLLPQLELEGRLSRAWFSHGGRRVYDEAASQVLGVWHLGPRQSLRAILQRQSQQRDGVRDFAGTTQSVTYAWRRSAGTVLYIGASRQRSDLPPTVQPPRVVGTEAFFKLQIDTDEVRGWF